MKHDERSSIIMIELRKRLHSKSYQQLNCDEDEDNDNETTELLTKKPNWEHFTHFDEPQQPKAKSASCNVYINV